MSKVESWRDYNRNITITRVSNGVGMAQEFSPDTPAELLQYSEIIQNGLGEINTVHQQKEIERLSKQLTQKEEKKRQDLKNIISYFYKRK